MNSTETRSFVHAGHMRRAARPGLRLAVRFALCAAAALFACAAHAAQGDNVALGKPVTMSGAPADPTLAGANCTDGNRGGNYPTDRICWTGVTQSGANREWIEVDLGQDTIIDRVRLSNRTDGSNGDFARWIAVTTRPSSLTGVTADPMSTLLPGTNSSAPFVNKIAYGAGTTAGSTYGTGPGDPWTTLDMKVGTHIARYVRIYTISPGAVLNLAEIEVFEGAPPSRSIVNTSFEQPAISAGAFAQIAETFVPGWSTTEPVAIPNAGFGTPFLTGGNIEMWSTAFQGVTADAGRQFVELNAYNNGALSPAPLCVYPGESFTWRVSHRARGGAGVVDVARLRINGQDVATFRDGVTQGGTHTCTGESGFSCTAQAGSPTATGWGRWQGVWTNAQSQPKAMTFEFAAISSSGGGGFGNFIDNVSITGLNAAIEFSTASASGAESVATANLPVLLVNGALATAQTVELAVGGTATRGSDYATNPAAGPIVVTIPAGNYDGTPATAISLAPYLQIQADGVVEGAETLELQLVNVSSGLSVAGASGCRAGIAQSTYTITDEAVPTLGKRFAPATIPYGGVATLTFLVDNSAAGAVNRSVGFTDNLATGLEIASPANATTTCGGTLTAAPGGSAVTLSGGSVAAGAVCSVSVDVTNRPGFSGLCYNPNFANENQNLVGLQNLIAQIEQYTCVSVTPPDCPDSATTNGFGNISGLSPNLSNGISGQCVAFKPAIELVKVSEGDTGSFGFALGNTSATGPVTVTTTAPGAPGTSAGVFDVLDMAQPVTIAETGLPAGWTLTGIACQLADGTPIGSFDAASGTWTVAPGDLAYGQRITCTATNQAPPRPQITIVKVPTALDGTPFAFATTAPAPDNAFTLSSGTSLTRTFTVAPGTVSISEAPLAGWVLTNLACTNSAGSATFTYTGAVANPTNGFERGDDTANVTLGYGDEVTCTYTNAPTALPTLTKFFNTDPPSSPPPPQAPVIRRGGTALLTFTIDNSQPATSAQAGLAFTDQLPANLVLAAGDAPPSALVGTNTCGGTLAAAAGSNSIGLSGGSVAAGAACSFTVRVTTAP
jgi:hypothetical protein